MTTFPRDVTSALATLQARWGAAAPRPLGAPTGDAVAGIGQAGAVVGALATVPLPSSHLDSRPAPQLNPGRTVSTGFAALDAILGPGGLPRGASVALRGAASSGAATLALRIAAESQAAGLIVAWLDLARSFDPVEACARGVTPDWLVVVTPTSPDEGLSIGGSLLAGRAVDLLVVDLPPRWDRGPHPGTARTATSSASGAGAPARGSSGTRSPGGSERLGRLAALARRAGSLLVVIEPPGRDIGLAGAVAEATGLHLELTRRSWIRLGRDVVGQWTAVTVGRNRYGQAGRSAELRILYAEGGERDACLQRDALLREDDGSAGQPGRSAARPLPLALAPSSPARGIVAHASASPLLAASPPGSRRTPLRLVPAGSGRDRRPPLDGRHRPGREPRRPRAGHPARDGAGIGPPARS